MPNSKFRGGESLGSIIKISVVYGIVSSIYIFMVSILQLLLLIFFLNQDDSLYFMIFLWLLYYVYVVFFNQESWSVSGWVILSAFICCHFLYVKNLHIIAWFICMANRNKILNQLNHAKLFFFLMFLFFICWIRTQIFEFTDRFHWPLLI